MHRRIAIAASAILVPRGMAVVAMTAISTTTSTGTTGGAGCGSETD